MNKPYQISIAGVVVVLMTACGLSQEETTVTSNPQPVNESETPAQAPSPRKTAADRVPGPGQKNRNIPAISHAASQVLSKKEGRVRPLKMESTALLHQPPRTEPQDRENYQHLVDNAVHIVRDDPVSTFSMDVDTGAYANMRRFLNQGQLPPKNAIRIEELVNYFSYDYPQPADGQHPFSITTEISTTPWNPDTYLLHVGIQGYDQPTAELPPANLVFLIDVSGSMRDNNKLPLLKSAMKMMVKRLRSPDRVSIIVYAGASGVVLEPTAGNEKFKINAALDLLYAGGSTNGAAGIRLAYALAQQTFIPDGINRVILATDGDFNVGTVNFDSLKQMIEDRRQSGIALSTLGFGTGNYNEQLMEQLADAGNGNYAYIDNINEARKALVDEMSSTLFTIAHDAKIQVEFNPGTVAEYRLIGYSNRLLQKEDFNNDKVDAGDIGAGHSVTALYEIALVDSTGVKNSSLRYKPENETVGNGTAINLEELALLRIRYKEKSSAASRLIEQPLSVSSIQSRMTETSNNYRFAAAVAAFGQILRGGKHMSNYTITESIQLARMATGPDEFGYRGEFVRMAGLANALM